jgi:large subunit ribosomal protein L4
MPIADVINEKNTKTGQVELPAAFFGGRISRPLLHEVTVLWMRNQRSGTAATKGRSLVSGGGKKPWKQKGTGRARSGHSRSPLWVGGGTIHGPQPRDYRTTIPRQKKRSALTSALSLQTREGNVVVLDSFLVEEPKTSRVAGLLKTLGLAQEKVLMVIPASDEKLEKAARNIPSLLVVTPEALNAYMVLYHRKIVFLKDALARVEEVFGR